MAFRTVEINNPADIHIRNGQLEIVQNEGIAVIPLEDITQIIASGANIRLSTMDLSIISQNKISLMTLDQRFLPSALLLPFDGNARQSKLMHKQVEYSDNKYRKLWMQIIAQKIKNQARALSILGLDGAEKIVRYADLLDEENVDYCEALAAKDYFSYYHKGLNRRSDDPVNSRLNYGYAVIRSAIARECVAVGFHPAFGIHHNSQLNMFNLADDLIESFRPMVDIAAYENFDSNEILTKTERKAMTKVLYNACIVNNTKMSVMSAITELCECLKRIICNDFEETISLPYILPVEYIEGITE